MIPIGFCVKASLEMAPLSGSRGASCRCAAPSSLPHTDLEEFEFKRFYRHAERACFLDRLNRSVHREATLVFTDWTAANKILNLSDFVIKLNFHIMSFS